MPRFPRVAARLRTIQSEHQLTHEQMAAFARAGLKAYGRWARGETEPRASHVANICDGLAEIGVHVSADYVVGRVDAPSGLTPGYVLVDLDLLEKLQSDPAHEYEPAITVPRRTRLVPSKVWEKDLAKAQEIRRGKK